MTTATVVVCVAGGTGWGSAPCPPGQTVSIQQAYLISPSDATKFELSLQPFDASTAGAYFGFAFASTITLYLISLGVGMVIKTVRAG